MTAGLMALGVPVSAGTAPPAVPMAGVASDAALIAETGATAATSAATSTTELITRESLSGFQPAYWTELLVEAIHTHLDVPWGAAIFLLSVGFRLMFFPLTVKQQKAGALARQNASSPEFLAAKAEFEAVRRNPSADPKRITEAQQRFLKVGPMNSQPLLLCIRFSHAYRCCYGHCSLIPCCCGVRAEHEH